MYLVTLGKECIEVATHVLEFVSISICSLSTTEADPSSLYTNFWKAVGWLKRFGFTTNYCFCDGGEANRSFVKMHFHGKDQENERFTTINPFTRQPMVFLLHPFVRFLHYHHK